MAPTTNNKPCAQHTGTSCGGSGHTSRTVTVSGCLISSRSCVQGVWLWTATFREGGTFALSAIRLKLAAPLTYRLLIEWRQI